MSLVPEAPRDQDEGPLTVLLRQLLIICPQVLSAVLVDNDGECVDYCSLTDPYEAKVSGAILSLTLRQVRAFAEATDIGDVATLEVHGTEQDLAARNLGEGYCIVVVTEPQGCDQDVMTSMSRVAAAICAEAGLPQPSWDSEEPGLFVETRDAVGWPFAPVSFAEGGGEPVRIIDVLGRWEEHGGLSGSQLTCFRVRLEDQREETLAYDETEDLWMRW